jgi:hypothetical protein
MSDSSEEEDDADLFKKMEFLDVEEKKERTQTQSSKIKSI